MGHRTPRHRRSYSGRRCLRGLPRIIASHFVQTSLRTLPGEERAGEPDRGAPACPPRGSAPSEARGFRELFFLLPIRSSVKLKDKTSFGSPVREEGAKEELNGPRERLCRELGSQASPVASGPGGGAGKRLQTLGDRRRVGGSRRRAAARRSACSGLGALATEAPEAPDGHRSDLRLHARLLPRPGSPARRLERLGAPPTSRSERGLCARRRPHPPASPPRAGFSLLVPRRPASGSAMASARPRVRRHAIF